MGILVFFLVISVNRRLFRYFGSYSGISVIPVILVNRRTDFIAGRPINWFRCCPPRVGQLVKTTVTTAVIG